MAKPIIDETVTATTPIVLESVPTDNIPAADVTKGVAVTTKPKVEAKEETVTLSAEAFNALMKRLETLETTSALVLQVQDKNKIQKIEELRRAGKLIKSVKVRRYAGKYIVGWKMVEDEVYKDENGRLIERQIVRIFFDGGTALDMSMRQWASAPEYISFEVTKESKDSDGNLFFTCIAPDGKTLELNASFIN